MSKPQFEFVEGSDGKHYFRLLSQSGETLLSGRGYASKSEAMEATEQVMFHGRIMERFDKTDAVYHTFQLKSRSGKILAWSESFHSKQGRENAIVEIRRIFQNSSVEETLN